MEQEGVPAWPKPPYYENPVVPEIPPIVSCFGEEICHRKTLPPDDCLTNFLILKIKNLVFDSEKCFRRIVSELHRGEDTLASLDLLRSIHLKAFNLITKLELVNLRQKILEMEVKEERK